MENINVNIDTSIFQKAKHFEKFREDCKLYLTKVGLNWDKFTIVSHDSFIGYITEYAISEHIKNKFPNVLVETWERQFDIKEIIRILKDNDQSEVSKELVKTYFYDKWDLKIDGLKISLLSDVKTALTALEPNNNWNFMYPVVQANKGGKDIMILVYYVVNDIKDLKTLKSMILIGYTNEETIKKCAIIKAGEITRFGTISQIDNYVTQLSKDYFNLNEIIK